MHPKIILEVRYFERVLSKIIKKSNNYFCFQTHSLLMEIILKNKRSLKLVTSLFLGCQMCSEVFFL